MSHIRGRDLEKAIARASQEYRRRGRRCILIKQETATATRPDGAMVYTRKGAPCDFIGAVDGTPWGIEAKSISGDSFPLEERREDQRRHLQILHDNGFKVWLCIEFVTNSEVYLVGWEAVADFLKAPWRKSLSLTWCRAMGMLLSESSTGGENRKVHFLDWREHPLGEQSREIVRAEMTKMVPVSLPLVSIESPPQRTRGPEKLTMDERMARIRQATQDGIENAAKTAKGVRKRSGWAGGGR